MIDIAVIPARGGSKGLPKKNLRQIDGISLVGHAIRSSVNSKTVLSTYVSTDNQEIAEDAEKHGAKVLWRAAHLASDASKTIDVVLDAIRLITSDICEANRLYNVKGCETVVSITECEHHPYKTLVMKKKGVLSPLKNFSFLEVPRQELPKCYKINGAIYINKIEQILRSHIFFCGKIEYYEMPNYRSIDIDNELDLVLAESLYKRNR